MATWVFTRGQVPHTRHYNKKVLNIEKQKDLSLYFTEFNYCSRKEEIFQLRFGIITLP